MIYGAILAVVLAVAGYIQYLRMTLAKNQLDNARLQSQAQQKEWDDKISASKLKITEEEKDYQDAEDSFRSKYGDGASDPNNKPG